MTDRVDLRRRLDEVAFRQAGYFSAAQAREVGYSYQAQKYHVDRGNWARVARALFRLAGWPGSVEDGYARWSVWSNGRGVVSHASAATLHDLGDLDPGEVHLSAAGLRAAPGGVVVHDAVLAPADVEGRGAFRVTTPDRTVLDLAGAATSVTQEQLCTVVLDAIRTDLVSVSALQRRMDAFGPLAALRLERALSGFSRNRQ